MLRTAAIALLLAVLLPPPLARAAGPAARRTTGGEHARMSDLPYIKCQVCELLAKNARRQARALLRTSSPSNPVHEDAVIELIEKITTAWRPEGEWIARLDLVEEGDALRVVEMKEAGTCGVECKTVERAAELIMGEHDTDVAEALYVGKKNRAQFTNWLCHELTDACATKPPPLPKDREPGPAFEPRQEGDQNLDAMLGGLEERGLGGQKVKDELRAKLGMAGADADGQAAVDAALKAAMAQAEGNGAAREGAPAEAEDEYSDEL